jgi:predicted DNA-binding transcriptional regulator YafY
VLAKIERLLPQATRDRIQAVEQTVIVEQSAFPTATSASVVTLLSTAVQTGQCVHLRYRSFSSVVTERMVDPYGVVYYAGYWYAIGYCHLRQGQRLFRLDRIQRVEATSETFAPPGNFDALDAVQRAIAAIPSVWQIKVWLETTLEEVQRQRLLPQACFEAVELGVMLRVDVEDLPWMARFLAGLGVPFIIHHPPELQSVLRDYALTLASYAQRMEA